MHELGVALRFWKGWPGMLIELGNRTYEIIRASNAVGMSLELRDITSEPTEELLFAFYSDEGDSFTFTAYKEDLPLSLVERFVVEARKRLPPVTHDTSGTE